MAGPSVLAIIPARGGSKGIPRKNVRLVAGRPLIGWVLEQCQLSRHLTRTVVSTDDAEIASTAEAWGAEIIPRPAEIAGDAATAEEALLHALAWLEEREGYRPDYVAYLQCTSPLTVAEDIDRSVELALEQGFDTVVPVSDFHYFLWEGGPADSAVGINHDLRFRPRRQDRKPQYLETGAVYILRTAGFLEARHRFFGKIGLYHMPAERVQEVDEPIDLLRCEFMLRARLEAETTRRLPQPISALAFDFDGVFTDNRVLVSQTGEEAVMCSRADGLGLQAVARLGVPMVVLSTEVNPVVAVRCKKLGIECRQGLSDKLDALSRWLEERGARLADTIFVGNDINDVACLERVGCAIVVADAHPAAKTAASIVLRSPGGRGAVRELCEMVLASFAKTVPCEEP